MTSQIRNFLRSCISSATATSRHNPAVKAITIVTIAVSCIFAQSTTPYYSAGYPAKTCADISTAVCALAQLCPTGTNCGSHSSIGGPGGIGNHEIFVSTNGGANVSYWTNSSANSQGFIVGLGGASTTWTFAPNAAGTPLCWPGVIGGGYIGGTSKLAFGSSHYFYKALMTC